MTQDERLDILVEGFKADSVEYRDIPTPESADEKRRLLRSLMNIRMPRPLPEDLKLVQDEYLRARAEEKGIVTLDDIPTLGSARPFADRLSLWQGDITRLQVDAIVNAANSAMLGCFQPCHNCIDNCIHTYAGVELRAECARQMEALRRRYGRHYEQPTAVPMLTDGCSLPAKKIVHIVGPIVILRSRQSMNDGLPPATAIRSICVRKTHSGAWPSAASPPVYSVSRRSGQQKLRCRRSQTGWVSTRIKWSASSSRF